MRARMFRPLHSMMAVARRAMRDQRGAALIEFSLVFPILIALLVGLVEFGEAFNVSRKLTKAASTASDLVSQMPTVADADLADITLAARALLSPHSGKPFGMIISSVVASHTNGAATTIAWSYATGNGASAHAPGAAHPLPAGLTEPGSSVIMVETIFEFTPPVSLYLTGTRELRGRAYFRPRVTRVVTRKERPD